MLLIGQQRWVIEAYIPKSGAKTKQAIDERTGETITVPDGEPEYEYVWFAGVGFHPDSLKPSPGGKQPVPVPMNVWTPYPAQAVKYKNKDEAEWVNKNILPDGTGIVIEWDKCHKSEGLHVIIPIKDEVLEAKSITGIDGKGRG